MLMIHGTVLVLLLVLYQGGGADGEILFRATSSLNVTRLKTLSGMDHLFYPYVESPEPGLYLFEYASQNNELATNAFQFSASPNIDYKKRFPLIKRDSYKYMTNDWGNTYLATWAQRDWCSRPGINPCGVAIELTDSNTGARARYTTDEDSINPVISDGAQIFEDFEGYLVMPMNNGEKQGDADDGEHLGCNPFTNADQIKGNIAAIRRGTCSFMQKISNAAAAGAQAVVLINHPGAGAISPSAAKYIIPALIIDYDKFFSVVRGVRTYKTGVRTSAIGQNNMNPYQFFEKYNPELTFHSKSLEEGYSIVSMHPEVGPNEYFPSSKGFLLWNRKNGAEEKTLRRVYVWGNRSEVINWTTPVTVNFAVSDFFETPLGEFAMDSSATIWNITNHNNITEVGYIDSGDTPYRWVHPITNQTFALSTESHPDTNLPIVAIFNLTDPTDISRVSMAYFPEAFQTPGDETASKYRSLYTSWTGKPWIVATQNQYFEFLGDHAIDLTDITKPRLIGITRGSSVQNDFVNGFTLPFFNTEIFCQEERNKFGLFPATRHKNCYILDESAFKNWKRVSKKTPFPLIQDRVKSSFNLTGVAQPISVSAGYLTCALYDEMSYASVRCWGIPQLGGDGANNGYGTQSWQTAIYPIPATIEFVDLKEQRYTVTDLSVGAVHSCAIVNITQRSTNGVWKSFGMQLFCWGSSREGKLGIGGSLWTNIGDTITPKDAKPKIDFGPTDIPIRIFAGYFHSCVILKRIQSNSTQAQPNQTKQRAIKCWGRGSYHQLGGEYPVYIQNNASIQTEVPINDFAIKLAIGGFHTCLLDNEGRIKCWGYNSNGQLGFKRGLDESVSLRASQSKFISFPNPSSKVTDICAGGFHTCALVDNKQVYCWGSNSMGQLGYSRSSVPNNYHSRNFSVSLPLNESITQLQCGLYHTCVLFSSSKFVCWGSNSDNQLGALIGVKSFIDDPAQLVPLPLSDDIQVKSLGCGVYHTCAVVYVRRDNITAVRCWGETAFLMKPSSQLIYNQLSRTKSSTIDAAPDLTPTDQIVSVSSTLQVCAILWPGKLKCWGRGVEGQLGVGSDVTYQGVTDPASSTPFLGDLYQKVIAARTFTCVLSFENVISCWGDHRAPANTLLNQYSNVHGGIKDFSVFKYDVFYDSICLLFNDGAFACGFDFGSTPLADNEGPVIESYPQFQFQAIEAGRAWCGILINGSVICWGNNGDGILGIGDPSISAITNITHSSVIDFGAGAKNNSVIKLSSGGQFVCALFKSGDVSCWGSSIWGALGYGSVETIGDDETPADVGFVDIGPLPAIDVSCGFNHVCIIVKGGKVKCWGVNIYGQLGYPDVKENIGDDEPPSKYGYLDLGQEVKSIECGLQHTCAVSTLGGIKCWGFGSQGTLGRGDSLDIDDPSKITWMSLTCGDGRRSYIESCDDGNVVSGDGCDKFCQVETDQWQCKDLLGQKSVCARCGNFLVELDEECDQGAAFINGSNGCRQCKTVEGWVCSSPEIPNSQCSPIPYDGLIVGWEKCDTKGVSNSTGCVNQLILPGYYCTYQNGSGSLCESRCQDKIKASDEDCDDGNSNNGDGCSYDCKIEDGWTCLVPCDSGTCTSKCTKDSSSNTPLIVGLSVGIGLGVILLLLLALVLLRRRRGSNVVVINESDLTFITKIGEGFFGEVWIAEWRGTTKVAVKMTKDNNLESRRHEDSFLKEVQTISQLPPHPNVVQFLGICRAEGKNMIITEYLEKGNVRDYLRRLASSEKRTLSNLERLQLCQGISAGMNHLHEANIIHRDLAARNILVEVKQTTTENLIVPKISDFGLSKASGHAIQLPVRWTAPELLKDPTIISKNADVWSFGIVIFEIFSDGMKLPYHPMKNNEVRELVSKGYKLPPPRDDESYVDELMHTCLQHYPEDRPSFLTLNQRITRVIMDIKGFSAHDDNSKLNSTLETNLNSSNIIDYEQQMEKDYENIGQSGYENISKK